MKVRYERLIEITLWLIILTCSFYFFVYKPVLKDNLNNTHYVLLNDAAGLVKGSPVRFNGINIGYVKNLKIKGNKVCASFIVKEKKAVLPQKTSASVEFYGLGASASLELYKGGAAAPKHGITPFKSYRIQDFWDGQKLSSETMIEMYDSLRISIDKSGLMQNKQILYQNSAVKEYVNQIHKLNHALIINKKRSKKEQT